MQRRRALPARDAAIVIQLVEPPAQIDLVHVRARARELGDITAALHVVTRPLLTDGVVMADDPFRVRLEAVDGEEARRREMLAYAGQAAPPLLRREHEKGVERDRDERERLGERERPHVTFDQAEAHAFAPRMALGA